MSESLSIYLKSLGETKDSKNTKKNVKRKICSVSSIDLRLPDQQGKPKRSNSQQYHRGNLKTAAFIKAEALRSRLDPDHPSFIKILVRTNVSAGFLMAFPASFCRKHMPQEDTCMVLESEDGSQYKAKYLPRVDSLSGGWKRFAISERLSIGDVLVFHMVSATKFKVFAFREYSEVTGALNLLQLDHDSDHGGPSDRLMASAEHKKQMDQSLSGAYVRNIQRPCNSENNTPAAHSRDGGTMMIGERVLNSVNRNVIMASGEHEKEMDQSQSGTDVRNMVRPSNSEKNASAVNSREGDRVMMWERGPNSVNCNGIIGYEDFSKSIDDLLEDFKLPEDIKRSYYELCHSRNTLLHSDILEGTNNILIAGMIIQTVTTADGLRNCQLSTSWDKVVMWDKELESFELLGMKVGFLRARLHCLQKIALDPELANCRQELRKLCSENSDVAAEIRHHRTILNEMKTAYKERAADIKELKSKIKSSEQEFKELVCSTPW